MLSVYSRWQPLTLIFHSGLSVLYIHSSRKILCALIESNWIDNWNCLSNYFTWHWWFLKAFRECPINPTISPTLKMCMFCVHMSSWSIEILMCFLFLFCCVSKARVWPGRGEWLPAVSRQLSWWVQISRFQWWGLLLYALHSPPQM